MEKYTSKTSDSYCCDLWISKCLQTRSYSILGLKKETDDICEWRDCKTLYKKSGDIPDLQHVSRIDLKMSPDIFQNNLTFPILGQKPLPPPILNTISNHDLFWLGASKYTVKVLNVNSTHKIPQIYNFLTNSNTFILNIGVHRGKASYHHKKHLLLMLPTLTSIHPLCRSWRTEHLVIHVHL